MANEPKPVETANAPPTADASHGLEQGTYEVIRQRLESQGADLQTRIAALNEARRNVFGAIPTQLLATERVTTANNCIPRDLVALGNGFIFGYNVQFGLKSVTQLEDVFAFYSFADTTFHEQPLNLLNDRNFQEDFHQLYKYYKDTKFAKFHLAAPFLYFVFQVGKTPQDVKAFKWRMVGDKLEYVDNRSEFEIRTPPQHEFEWKRAGRDAHRKGRHPHVSIEDIVFVESIGGDLTIKVEDNTESGAGVFSEPVSDADQTLDDAEILYSIVGNLVLLKIRPFKENDFRYLVFNRKTQTARRLDSIAQACVLLPESHGLIFPNGCYLQTGEYKVFENTTKNLQFERRIAASNGEDHLYVFYSADTGEYVLLSYNMIEQRLESPIQCHGFSFFENGHLVFFRDSREPQKHHALQIWQTPFTQNTQTATVDKTSMLYKIGNRDIVRGMAECHEIGSLIRKGDSYTDLYVDLMKKSTAVLDSYFWLSDAAAMNLGETLVAIRDTAKNAIDEYEKVVKIRANTRQQLDTARQATLAATQDASRRRFDTIEDFVKALSTLRKVRGQLVSLRSLKYIDLALVSELEDGVEKQSLVLSQKCIEFLGNDAALAPYQKRVDEHRNSIEHIKTVAEGKKLAEILAADAGELELLIEIVSNLKIEDSTRRTAIIDRISAIYSLINQAKATLKNRIRELLSVEGAAEFSSEMKLLSQAVVNYLDVCETPERCDEYLTKIMVQVEEVEGRFAEFDEFVVQLAEKREEIYSAFDTKRMQIQEGRNRRAAALMTAAERILSSIKARVNGLDSIDEINSYFAADLMIEKVRDTIKQLGSLNESVKVDDLQSRLKTIREDAVRQLRDKKELFVEGQNAVKFGKHAFSVNSQALDLTILNQNDRLCFHLTGTKFLEPIVDAEIESLSNVWNQELVSENRVVYRSEFLAKKILTAAMQTGAKPDLATLAKMNPEELLEHVRQVMAPRFQEGYVKGIHDHDATKILATLLQMVVRLGPLKFSCVVRAGANHFRAEFRPIKDNSLIAQCRLLRKGAAMFGFETGRQRLVLRLAEAVKAHWTAIGFSFPANAQEVAELLFETAELNELPISRRASELAKAFEKELASRNKLKDFQESLKSIPVSTALEVTSDWLTSYSSAHTLTAEEGVIFEAAQFLVDSQRVSEWQILEEESRASLKGLIGEHARVEKGEYHLDFIEFTKRLDTYERDVVPQFERFMAAKHRLLAQRREQLKLEEFKPRVLSSFVRNKLINEIYLPLVGDNLAKQIGVTGEDKRTDLMGLLLLISPPGYGKTTLMEYIASRLGLTFVKINGPAIGHRVLSLDPAEAPNASAREEVLKLNLSLEMGDNVMIYVDDIQHCHPEFLQKFISLCDATRRIEGVFNGKSRTYDLRGRKVCVCMAGNPYTESGEKFKIPDMLANRADTYNLGDVIGASQTAFEQSYLENALTSNRSLQRLNAGERNDIEALFEMALSNSPSQKTLTGNYTVEEIQEIVEVLRKLARVREVLLKINRNYIDSAAQADAYRTEPPFRLQGSYRDMNKLAEKIVPIMNERELQQLIETHYENQAQTLTQGAESNLLKFREILGTLTESQRSRWEDIKRTFKRNLLLGAAGTDNVAAQLIGQLTTLSDGLHQIKSSVDQAATAWKQGDSRAEGDPLQQLMLAQIGQGVGELARFSAALEEIRGVLERRAEVPAENAASGKPESQRIYVVNKVPQAFLEIIRYQFETLEQWLAPLNKLAETLPPAKGISQKAKRIAKQFQQIVRELEENGPAEPMQPPPEDTP